jgi:LysM repeat protein
LQIGWELKLPGCGDVGTTTELAAGSELAATETAGTGTGDEGDLAQINPAPGASSGQKTTHVIQSGETIYSIARRYGVDPQAIIDANGLANPNFIQPGQTLIIPAAQ